MNNSGEYLTKLMGLESVTKEELMSLTGKKDSTVSSWLRYTDSVVPKYKDLGIICQRLGISFDDFYNQTYPNHLLSMSNNLYKLYLFENGSSVDWIISSELFENKNYKDILFSYVNDMFNFKTMITNALNGKNIDSEKFNTLCIALHIQFQSQEAISLMCYDDIELYKCYLDEVEETGIPEDPIDRYMIIRPYSRHIFLRDEVDRSITGKYIETLFKDELNWFMMEYLEKVEKDKAYDKNNYLLKIMLKSNADVLDKNEVKNYDLLYKLLKRLL